MDPVLLVSTFLVVAVITLALVIRSYRDIVGQLRDELRESSYARRRTAEAQQRQSQQWAPVLARYPFDARRFRHVGGPIDGVQFDEDRVALIVFTGEGRGEPDGRVRELVRAGRVDWVEVPLGDQAPPPQAPPLPSPPPAEST